MIQLNLMAGMGNQMFEYAYARALALEYNELLVINPYFMTLAGIGAGRKKYYNNVLELLNIPSEVKMISRKKGYISGIKDITEFVAMRKFHNGEKLHGIENFHKLNRKGKYYTDDCFTFFESNPSQKTKKKIIGYYQSEKYFCKYRDIIREELKVIKEPSEQNKVMLHEIDRCNAVCVHIRRGDYVSNSKNAALVVCDESYYQRAMKYIAEKVENPIFYVFSDNNDEIAWIKANYHFNYNVRYVMLNNSDYEELRLMYHCRHFIIANSTFSWWGAYLSENQDKLVIAPKVWNKDYKEKIDLYTEDMILM